MRWLIALSVVCLGSQVWAHPKGFHKRITLNVSKYAVDGLLVMDVDSGDRCALLRAGADANHDGKLEGAEVTALKDRLVGMLTRALKLSISNGPLPISVKETKLSLREDNRVNESGLSVAALLDITHPLEVSPGMTMDVTDTAPDFSVIVLEVAQVGESAEPPFKGELPAGETKRVRLGVLAKRE